MPPSQSPAMAIGSSEDLSTQILLRLPPNSVLKFKLVSKLWLSIVSSPRFRLLHASSCGLNPSPTILLFKLIGSNYEEFVSVPLKSDNNSRYHSPYSLNCIIKGTARKLKYKYRSSCNGLLLVKSYDYNDPKYDDGEYYVVNPTTKEFKNIHIWIPSILPITNKYFLEYLAFDPSQSPHYKVVIVSFEEESGNKLKIYIYSSENEIRRPKINDYSFDLDPSTPRTSDIQEIFCNGMLHLLGLAWTAMLCFDLNRKCLIKCALPSGFVVSSSIKQSRGTIYLIVGMSDEIDVHELKRDYSGWFPKYKVGLTFIAIACQRIKPNFPCPSMSIYAMTKSIISSCLCEEGPTMVFEAFDQLVAYNLTRKTTKIVGNVELLYNTSYTSFSQVYPHIETLARV